MDTHYNRHGSLSAFALRCLAVDRAALYTFRFRLGKDGLFHLNKWNVIRLLTEAPGWSNRPNPKWVWREMLQAQREFAASHGRGCAP